MRLELEGKSVLIAGASRGIGLATASAFLTEGANVVLAARDGDTLQNSAAGLAKSHQGRVRTRAADLSAAPAIIACLAEDGPFDIVVINYGNSDASPAFEEAAASWDRLLSDNLTGPMRLAHEAARHMRGRGGCIVFVGSIAGREMLGAPLGYAVGKHALAAVVKSFARELGPSGVRVNLVLPGNVIFEGGRWAASRAKDPAAVDRTIAERVPLQRFGTPEEIADVIVFIASPRAAFITGAGIVVDGGQTVAF